MNPTLSKEEAIDGHAITCLELVRVVTEYLEGTLHDGERSLFEAHLHVCEGCRRHLEQIRITIATTGRLREEDLPADARIRLLSAFQTWKRSVG